MVFTPGLHLGDLEWLADWLAKFAFHRHLILKVGFSEVSELCIKNNDMIMFM